jgi:hypothetical protein
MKARIRITMVTGTAFVYEYDGEEPGSEEKVIAYIGECLQNEDFIDFETGRFILAVPHIVSIESSRLTQPF